METKSYKYNYNIYIQVYDDRMACETAMFVINTNDYITAINVASAVYRSKYKIPDENFTVEIVLGIERVIKKDEI